MIISASTRAPSELKYLSIKEAAHRFRCSEITIRRFVRTVLDRKKQSERHLIQPRPLEVATLKKKGRPFSYTISATLLEAKFGKPEKCVEKHGPHMGPLPPAEYVALLEHTNGGLLEQLRVKDDQIKALNSSLEGLSERQRETNVLMKIMQERFLLPVQTETRPAGDTKRKRWWWRRR